MCIIYGNISDIMKRKSGLIHPSGRISSPSKDDQTSTTLHPLRKDTTMESIEEEKYGSPTSADVRERYAWIIIVLHISKTSCIILHLQ